MTASTTPPNPPISWQHTEMEPVAIQPNDEPDSSIESEYDYERQSSNPNKKYTSPEISCALENGEATPTDNQGEPVLVFETKEAPLDKIMTGWDPLPPVAGQKRPHLPVSGRTRSKRGREVKQFHG